MAWSVARYPGPKKNACGTQVTPAFSASVATCHRLVSPPILTTLGCTKSVAPAEIIFWKSSTPVAFSPIASGTPVARLSTASASKSSGGQIGSSTQNGFEGAMAATGAVAWSAVQAQLVSTMIGMSGPATSRCRRDAVRGPLVQLEVTVAPFERPRDVAAHVLDRSTVLQQRRIGFHAPSPHPAEQRGHRLAFQLAADVPQRDVEPADRMHHRATPTEAMQQAFQPRSQAAVARILSDGDMLDPGIEHDGNHGRTAAVGLAPADHATAGGDAHQQHVHVRPRLAGELRRRRPS